MRGIVSPASFHLIPKSPPLPLPLCVICEQLHLKKLNTILHNHRTFSKISTYNDLAPVQRKHLP